MEGFETMSNMLRILGALDVGQKTASEALRNFRIARHGLRNYILKKPLCVSFEVTYRCNARCEHCHLGSDQETCPPAPPARFGERCRELDPLVAQISGGEPLLRPDILQIVKEIRRPGSTPIVVLTTNAALLKKETYYALKGAGVDEFSVSLDFPDERHDVFRSIPGLFRKIERLLLDIKDEQRKGITLACVVQRQNYHDLILLAEFARKHGVKISFSTYTWLRTGDKSWMVPKEELSELRNVIRQLLDFKRRYGTIFTSEYVFQRMVWFFEKERMPGCRAGDRFLVVNPDGTLSPCGLQIRSYKSRREIVEHFLASNTCEACTTSIRANTEKSWDVLLTDAIRNL